MLESLTAVSESRAKIVKEAVQLTAAPCASIGVAGRTAHAGGDDAAYTRIWRLIRCGRRASIFQARGHGRSKLSNYLLRKLGCELFKFTRSFQIKYIARRSQRESSARRSRAPGAVAPRRAAGGGRRSPADSAGASTRRSERRD